MQTIPHPPAARLRSPHQQFVYGPVRSRRLGSSLGVNPFPPGRKVCNFNCAYCQYGWTRREDAECRASDWPRPSAIAHAAGLALRRLRDTGRRVDRVTLAGSGEPTLHPRFAELVERLVLERDEAMPSARLALLSNASTLDRPAVREALAWVDEAYLKLDAADPDLFRRLNGPRDLRYPPIERLRELRRVTLQSLFARDERGRLDNAAPQALDAWLEALVAIQPSAVHIYTLDRAPAWAELAPVPRTELNAIAARVRAAGLHAEVF